MSNSSAKSVGGNIQESKFIDFFTNLNTHEPVNNEFQSNVIAKLHTMEAQNIHLSTSDPDLNKEIDTTEIMKAIKELKYGKSASGDDITNEMLKHGSSVFINALKKLFNHIFNDGKFPSCWNESYIVLLHKKGSKNDPANYRGISLTSCLGKLFNKVINARLLKYIDTRNLISENQIGFKQDSRTSDHILTLKSIIDFKKSKKEKVFAAFIDLRKAFDTVWRDGLFYKMLLNGINGKTFNIIRSMYTNNTFKIKFANGLSKQIPSTCGVKQGDVLSPLLFNLFIDDLVQNLNTFHSGAISFNGLSINSLLYADDIVILANSKEALQTFLDILDNFCTSWKLHINTDKSKVVVFNSNGKCFLDTFMCANHTLETVNSYCYLGVTFKHTGSLTHTSTLLMEKAKKALFKIKNTIELDNPCNLLEKLFDNLVIPVMLYCSEIWGVICQVNDSTPYEYLHLKFLKEILGVHSKASNDACRAELNRLPLRGKILNIACSYWQHLWSSPNSLVSKIVEVTKSHNNWFIQMGAIFNTLGFSYFYDSPNFSLHDKLSIKQRITDIQLQEQNMRISNTKKLNILMKFYRSGTRPYYVDFLKNRAERAMLSKLRISAHKLAIEGGRYMNIPKQERICTACNSGEVEDEEHFLLSCSLYRTSRQALCSKLIKLNYQGLNLRIILDNNNHSILKMSASFIENCFKQRESAIS